MKVAIMAIKKYSVVKRYAEKMNKRLNRAIAFCRGKQLQPEPAYWVPRILKDKKVQIVQIGSNDGVTGDPIYGMLQKRREWKALFVEPVPYLFERLRVNYGEEERFKFENSVINDGKTMTFYWVSEKAKESIPGLPRWYDQLGGFDREHIINHKKELEPFIEESQLSGITLEALFEKHSIVGVDMLHIDTEGADFLILSQLDLGKHSPQIIMYEHIHLSVEEKQESIAFLNDRYVLYTLHADILAVRRDIYKKMETKLNRLRGFLINAVN